MSKADTVHEDFSSLAAQDPSSRWHRYVVGNGSLEPTGSTLRFVTTNASSRQYSDAQIDDYQGLPRRRFLWRPPLRLTVRARFSHPTGDGPAERTPGLRGIREGATTTHSRPMLRNAR